MVHAIVISDILEWIVLVHCHLAPDFVLELTTANVFVVFAFAKIRGQEKIAHVIPKNLAQGATVSRIVLVMEIAIAAHVCVLIRGEEMLAIVPLSHVRLFAMVAGIANVVFVIVTMVGAAPLANVMWMQRAQL